MKTTMSTPANGNKTWTTISVTVENCIITGIVAPPAPTNLSYTIFEASLVNDLTTPGF